MPPKYKFTKEAIIQAALSIARTAGFRAITARAVGAKLNSSSKVIFSLFKNMEELQAEVIAAADKIYQSYLEEDMTSGKYPPYKASGIGYIRFAREEKELFKLLFMRDRTHENIGDDKEELKPLLELIQQKLGLNEESAYLFHLKMWIYVHGIATMLATSYLEWDDEFISRVVTDGYEGLKTRYVEGN